jgi:hypothetical protein
MKCKLIFVLTILFLNASLKAQITSKFRQISGVYPHLAFYNNESECGTGAVVPWANRLWAITYGPHLPFGSSDKLYEISNDLLSTVRPESIGGTPANRMIHKESNQLFIGPYAISALGQVRNIPYSKMPGRHTGNARHLSNPQNKIYYGTMEEGFYEVDVYSLEPKMLYQDGNVNRKTGQMAQEANLLSGAHGKGLYSGQGVLVYSNNGEAVKLAEKKFDIESGLLAEWNAKDWNYVRRNQFVEVTGPGGIYGNENPATDPIWATGWDHKSVILSVRDQNKWTFFRLPKASHSYDGAHGWNTEWPRIRDVGTPEKPDYLMTMHGMFWTFPKTFSLANTAGIRPRSAYLKVIGDFTRWQNQLVFGCDDSAQKEFLNRRKAKGNIEGPGQSNSNLWFTELNKPDLLGPNTANGSVWIEEEIKAQLYSEPFLFAGWENRLAWLKNSGSENVTFTFEVDLNGKGNWKEIRKETINPGNSAMISFKSQENGEWIRVKTDKNTIGTLSFNYTDNTRFSSKQEQIFDGLSAVSKNEYSVGLLYGLGQNRRKLGLLSGTFSDGKFIENGYYELDSLMNLSPKEDQETANFIRKNFEIPKNVVKVEESSVLVVDDKDRRWRLPKGSENFTEKIDDSAIRICREVATERDLMNLHGTFYELPAENADGFAKIRPIATHNLAIHDYASYRGLLIMTGLDSNAKPNEHVISSTDGKAKVWAGSIDDLWTLGKPKGHGGPWLNSEAIAHTPSDPYLIGFYDQKKLQLSHKSNVPVTFKIEIEAIGHGPWMTYKEVIVKPNETFHFTFPSDFQARWIRFSVDKNCNATSILNYE